MDHHNPIISNEIYAIILDAVPMIVAFFLLNVAHPGIVLRGAEGNFGRGDGKHELLEAALTSIQVSQVRGCNLIT